MMKLGLLAIALFTVLAFGEPDCSLQPLPGGPGHESIDPALRFHDYLDADRFLERLSHYTYSFDARYLSAAAASISKSEAPDLASLFVMNALAPYLRGLGYSELRRRYLVPALQNLSCLNTHFGIGDLKSLKQVALFQASAAKLLVHSLESSRTLMSEPQRLLSAEWIRLLGDLLAQGLDAKALTTLSEHAGRLETLFRDLGTGPFLRSRSLTDLQLLVYLLEK